MGRRAAVSTQLTDALASQIAADPLTFPEFSWDNAITGFGIRRYPSGKVSWIIKVKTRVKVLGRVGELSEVEARIHALTIIKDGGVSTEKAVQNQPVKPTHLTVQYCFDRAIRNSKFLEGRASKTKTTTHKYLHEILERLPELGTKQFAELNISDLIEIKDCFEEKGASSRNNILLAVKQVWDFYRFKDAEVQKVWGDLPVMSLSGLKERRQPRTDRLTPEQLSLVYQASEKLDNPYQTAFIKLSILTCRRNQTVTHMRWADLDLEKRVWTIPSEFNRKGRGQSFGREEWLPLTDTIIEIIKSVPNEGPYVVGGKTPITAGSKLLAKIKKLSEIEVDDRGNSWTFHGFRRSMASSSMGALDTRVIDLIQGRVETGAAAHYYQGEYLGEKLRGLLEWELIVFERQVESVSTDHKPARYTRKVQGASPIWEVAFRLLWFKYRDELKFSQARCIEEFQKFVGVKTEEGRFYPLSAEAFVKIKQNGRALIKRSPVLKEWSEKHRSIDELKEIVEAGNRYRQIELSDVPKPVKGLQRH